MASKRSIPPIYVGIMAFALGLLIATLLNTRQEKDSTHSSENREALFTLQNTSYFAKDLPYTFANNLYQLEHDYFFKKQDLMKQAAFEIHLNQLAEEKGAPRDEIVAELVPSAPISDEELSEFYEKNKDQIRQPFYKIKEALRNALANDKKRQAEMQLIDQLVALGQLSIQSQEPVAPFVKLNIEGYPVMGNENAPITVAEFIDYRCSHCRTASETLKKVQQTQSEKVKLVVIDLPILGKVSEHSALTAFCAHEQNKFWDLHEALFAQQGALKTKEKVTEIAEGIGLDTASLSSCMDSAPAKEYLKKSLAQAMSLGLTSTPAIFINGIQYRGSLSNGLQQAVISAAASAP